MATKVRKQLAESKPRVEQHKGSHAKNSIEAQKTDSIETKKTDRFYKYGVPLCHLAALFGKSTRPLPDILPW